MEGGHSLIWLAVLFFTLVILRFAFQPNVRKGKIPARPGLSLSEVWLSLSSGPLGLETLPNLVLPGKERLETVRYVLSNAEFRVNYTKTIPWPGAEIETVRIDRVGGGMPASITYLNGHIVRLVYGVEALREADMPWSTRRSARLILKLIVEVIQAPILDVGSL